jgi:hypothetical protein
MDADTRTPRRFLDDITRGARARGVNLYVNTEFGIMQVNKPSELSSTLFSAVACVFAWDPASREAFFTRSIVGYPEGAAPVLVVPYVYENMYYRSGICVVVADNSSKRPEVIMGTPLFAGPIVLAPSFDIRGNDVGRVLQGPPQSAEMDTDWAKDGPATLVNTPLGVFQIGHTRSFEAVKLTRKLRPEECGSVIPREALLPGKSLPREYAYENVFYGLHKPSSVRIPTVTNQRAPSAALPFSTALYSFLFKGGDERLKTSIHAAIELRNRTAAWAYTRK